jgi:hypothetical protein
MHSDDDLVISTRLYYFITIFVCDQEFWGRKKGFWGAEQMFFYEYPA